MQWNEPERRQPREMLLPMINVVFLLLIFLMVMGHVAVRSRLEIDPARSTYGMDQEAALHLFLDADGQVQFRSTRGRKEALASLRQALEQHTPSNKGKSVPVVTIRADANTDFSALLQLARDIQGWRQSNVRLEVRQR